MKVDIHQHLPTPVVYEWVNMDVLKLMISSEWVNSVDKAHKEKVAVGDAPKAIKQRVARSSLYRDLTIYHQQMLKDGRVRMSYKTGKDSDGLGRVYATGPSLQNFPRLIRELLSHGVMQDYDFGNCEPTCLDQLCDMHDIPHPVLKEYIQNREPILEELMASNGITRKEAKKIPLRIVNGGGATIYADGEWKNVETPWLRTFYNESQRTLDAICSVFKDELERIRKLKESNPKGKTVAGILFTIERHCIEALLEFLSSKELTVHVLIHDGLQASGPAYDGMLQDASDFIFEKTSFRLFLEDKAIAQHDLTALIPLAVPIPEPEPTVPEPAVPEPPQFLERQLFNRAAANAAIISCLAHMNMGKTERTMEFIIESVKNGFSIVAFSQRITMARTFTARICSALEQNDMHEVIPEVTCYNQKKGELDDRIVICEYESGHRVSGSYKICILDEFRSMITTMASVTNGKYLNAHWDNLKRLVAMADTVVVLDADMAVDGAAYEVQDMLMAHRKKVRSDIMMQEAVDAQRNGGDYGQHLANINQMLHGDVDTATPDCLFCDKKHSQNGICRIENNVIKMRRRVVWMEKHSAINDICEHIANGKRVAIMCGSVSFAERLKQFITNRFPTKEVGLYTGRTDNEEHFNNLAFYWDLLDIIIYTSKLTTGADYNTPMYKVYVFPSMHTCTPRDCHQGLYRIRNPEDKDIVVCISEKVYDQIITIDRAMVDANVDKCKQKLYQSGFVLQNLKQEKSNSLRFTVGPTVCTKEFERAPSELIIIKAYAEAEREYTKSLSQWASYFLYMAKLKVFFRLTNRHQ